MRYCMYGGEGEKKKIDDGVAFFVPGIKALMGTTLKEECND